MDIYQDTSTPEPNPIVQYWKHSSVLINGQGEKAEVLIMPMPSAVRLSFLPDDRLDKEDRVATDTVRHLGRFRIWPKPKAGRFVRPDALEEHDVRVILAPPIVFALRDDNRGMVMERVEVPNALFYGNATSVECGPLKVRYHRIKNRGYVDQVLRTIPREQPRRLFDVECSVCGDVARQQCPCGEARYCSVGCQREDWEDAGHSALHKGHI